MESRLDDYTGAGSWLNCRSRSYPEYEQELNKLDQVQNWLEQKEPKSF
jgi:hypothetical protein